jgi:hypothetical protein
MLASGRRDEAFGVEGVVKLPQSVRWTSTLARQPDGRWLVGFARTDFHAGVMRLLPDGQPDSSFGVAGAGADLASTASGVNVIAVDADGKIVIAGKVDTSTSDDDSLVARMLGTEITTPVVEFHNGLLDHYFVTADPHEAAAIDAGAAGPGWSRTGQTFKSGGPNRVCRFYGSPEIDPVTQKRRGPNSHFYTIEVAECGAVKTDAGWKFESHDFNGWPMMQSACPQGTQAIKRVYNKRFAQNDSNHRYVSTEALYQLMLAQGWAGEGTVYCAVL